MKLIFVNYWDVWGNEADGWDVNDVSRHTMKGSKPETAADVLSLLIANDIVHSDVTLGDVEIEIDSCGAEITETGRRLDLELSKPFGRIEWENE